MLRIFFWGSAGKARSGSGLFVRALLLLSLAVTMPSRCLAFGGGQSGIVGGPPATTTTLAPLTTVASGTAVTLTATVADATSGAAIYPGTVIFCDATAAHCLNSARLGTAQLGAGGKASLALVPGIGAHSYTAIFVGTRGALTSTSAVQTLSVTGTYPSSLTLSSSGPATGYTLSATLTGTGSLTATPSGSVVFQDTSNGNYTLKTASLGSASAVKSLVPAASASASGTAPTGVAVGDFNGDGKADLAVASSSGITILIGNGDGTFTTGPALPSSAPYAIAVGDFNNDGKLDIAATNFNSATVSIYLGNGTGAFQGPTTFATAANPDAIAVADFNNDGNLDLIVTSQSTNSATVLLNNGAGSFSAAPSSISLPANPSSVVVGDFNGDGNMDVAITDMGTTAADGVYLTVMLGEGNGNFIQAPGSPIDAGRLPSSAVVGDFNGDGVLDIAVASANDNVVRIFQGKGDGTFTAVAPTTGIPVGGGPDAMAIGDFNADGIADLTVTNPLNANLSGTQSVLIGKGDGTFAAAAPYPVGFSGSATVVADFNGDGYTDIATAVAGSSNTVSVLLDEISNTQTVTVGPLTVPGAPTPAHLVDATYAGDTNFSAATSNTVSLTGSLIGTTLRLAPNLSSASYGQQIVLTATLTPSALGTYETDGETVYFKNTLNNSIIGTAVLSGGVAVFNTTTLAPANYSITAVYHADANFQGATSAATPLTVTPATPAINWTSAITLQYGTMLSTAETATSPVAGTFSYSITPSSPITPYTLLPVGSYTLTATFTPSVPADYTTASASTSLTVSAATTVITWPTPAPVTYGTQLSSVQLDATATSTTIVPLTSYYNVYGIFSTGTAVTHDGFDGYGYAYNGNSLGTSISWNGVTYPLGPVNAADAVSNITINLPQGHFSSLNMLGALVNNASASNVFTITYTDGTTTSSTQWTQGLSDWVYPQNYAGESTLVCDISRNASGGGQDTHSTCVYGYQIPLDPTKIVVSVTMPATRNVVMLAMGLTTASVPGQLVYTPTFGTTPALGTDTLSVSFAPKDPSSYAPASASVQLSVTQAATYIQWPTPAPISYGTPLSDTQLDAQAYAAVGVTVVPLSTYYRVNAMFPDGTSYGTTGFNNAGSAYSSTLLGSSVSWNGITFPLGPTGVPDAVTSTTIALPAGNYSTLWMIGAGASAQPGQTFTVTYVNPDGTTSTSAAQVSMSSWTQPGNYSGESIVSTTAYEDTSGGGETTGSTYIYGYQIALDPTKTVQSITLPANRSVVLFGIALGGANTAQLIAGGNYAYAPPTGTVLTPGTHTLSVAFTSPDTTEYGNATGSTQIVVGPQNLVVTATSQTVVYGTPLKPYAYTITGFVNGDTQASVVTGTPSLTTTPATPTTVNSYPIVAGLGMLAAGGNYTFTFVNGTATITQATPVISWPPPASIPYGTPLSTTQLDATVTGVNGVSLQNAGSFTYSPTAGTVLSASSTPQTLSVTFTPTDSIDYTTVTATVPITVTTATPTVTWPTPAPITYGTPLSTTQLDPTASVAGTFSYSPTAGTVLPASSQPVPLTATFTPSSGNYAPITTTVYLMVNKATPVISWPAPANITYGTPLSTTQLDATVTGVNGVSLQNAGSFTYSPTAGTVLSASSTPQTLSVTFTPTDSIDYTTVTTTVPITVTTATPTVTWPTPAPITYGTPLSTTQLDPTASVAGTFSYSPTAGTVLPASSQPVPLTATFTPSGGNYAPITTTVYLTVNKATPAISWPVPASIPYGTALSTTQLDATAIGVGGATVNGGNYVYMPAAGAVLAAGPQRLSVTFTPTGPDADNYGPASGTVMLTVTPASLTLNWANPSPIIYGTLLSNQQLDASLSNGGPGGVNGATTYSPTPGTLLPVGTYTLSATFTPVSANYSTITATVQLTVTQATPVITWPTPASISYGTALGAAQQDATAAAPIGGANVPGNFAYTPAAGTVLPAGQQQLAVTFTPSDTRDFTTATATVPLSVTGDALTAAANNFTRLYGVANPSFTGTVTGAKNGDAFTESFTTTATITSNPGTYPIVPAASGNDLNDYTVGVQDGTLTITKAPAILTLSTSATTIASGLNVNLTANVVSTTSGTPTGTVQFLANGNVIGTATLSSGVATLATTALPVGANTITAIYSGDTDFTSTTVAASSGAVSVNVTPLDFIFQVTSAPTVEGTYGTTRTFTLHVAPIGWEYPGEVDFAATQTGPFFSKYSFSPATVAQNAGAADITFTVDTQKLAMEEHSVKLSRIAFGLFLLPLLGWRRSRKAGSKLRRAVLHSALLLAALGAAGAMTGCGGTYYDHVYPMTVTATSNGIQHTVTLQFHIDQSSQ